MSKSRNPGYVGGDHWETCDRCGQAFRSSQMKTQWDGLRVCQKDYDTRHQQDAVRETGSGCGTGPGGAGLDWNWGGGGYKPDLDPTTFIQEPNDAYFTNPPDGNFGGPGTPDYCVPDGEHFTCSTFSQPHPLNAWGMATDTRSALGASISNLEQTLGFQDPPEDPADCGINLKSAYHTCYYSSDPQTTGENYAYSTGSTESKWPVWTCDVGMSKDGDSWPAFAIDATTEMTLKLPRYYTVNFDGQTAGDNHATWLLVLSDIDASNGDTTFLRTSTTAGGSDQRAQPDEGLRLYNVGSTLKLGFRIPKESRYHPDNGAYGEIGACAGTCWDATTDLDFYIFDIDPTETFMLRIEWYDDRVIFKKNSGVEEYTINTLLAGYTESFDGGYIPAEAYLQTYATNEASYYIYEWIGLYNATSYPKVTSAEIEQVEEYLSWKYNIEIPNRNFPSCSA
jgi:hypothetical protein